MQACVHSFTSFCRYLRFLLSRVQIAAADSVFEHPSDSNTFLRAQFQQFRVCINSLFDFHFPDLSDGSDGLPKGDYLITKEKAGSYVVTLSFYPLYFLLAVEGLVSLLTRNKNERANHSYKHELLDISPFVVSQTDFRPPRYLDFSLSHPLDEDEIQTQV